MIFKIVKYTEARGVSNKRGSSEEKVGAYENWIYEKSSAKYSKINVRNIKELEKVLVDHVVIHWPYGDGNLSSCNCGEDDAQQSECRFCRKGTEFIVLNLEGNYAVFPECSLYVMNNDGKTIDTIHCMVPNE